MMNSLDRNVVPLYPADELVDGDTYETKTTEEWVTSRKREVVKTTQVETRVKRQVILEDGDVINDTGPEITTETTEDVVEKNHEAEERKHGGKPNNQSLTHYNFDELDHPNFVVREKREKIVNTQEEKEEKTETEEVEHLGDLSHEELVHALRNGSDVRGRLQLKTKSPYEPNFSGNNKRVIHYSSRHRKTVDTEDVKEESQVKDGQITSETTRTFEREEYKNEEVPDSGGESGPEDLHLESSHNITHSKNENVTEYLAVPRGAPLSKGIKIGEVVNYSKENFQENRKGDNIKHIENISDRFRKHKRDSNHTAFKKADFDGVERKDALTERPLDFDLEEATRKMETCKWLNEHFGSETNSSKTNSSPPFPAQNATYGGNVIKITMLPEKVENNDREITKMTKAYNSGPVANGYSAYSSSNSPHNTPKDTTMQSNNTWHKDDKSYGDSRSPVTGYSYKSPRENTYGAYRSRIETPTPLKDSPWAKSTYKSPLETQVSYMSRVANASDSGSLSSPLSPNTTKSALSPLPPWKDVYNSSPKPWSATYSQTMRTSSPLHEEYNRIVQELKNDELRKSLRPVELRPVDKTNGENPPIKPERRKSPSKQNSFTSNQYRQHDLSSPVYSPRGYSTLPNAKKISNLERNESYTMGTPTKGSYIAGETSYKSPSYYQEKYLTNDKPSKTNLEPQGSKSGSPRHLGYTGEPPLRRSSVGDTLDGIESRHLRMNDYSQTLPKKSFTKTMPDLNASSKVSNGLPKFYFGDYSGSLVNVSEQDSIYSTGYRNPGSVKTPKAVNRSQSFNVARKSMLSNGLSSSNHNRVNFGSKVTIHGETSSQAKLREPQSPRRVTRTNSMRTDLESGMKNGFDTKVMNEKNRRMSAKTTDGVKPEHDTTKRKAFLQGLLNTAPELFMHLHGDEEIQKYDLKKEGNNKYSFKQINKPPTPPPRKKYSTRLICSPTPLLNYTRQVEPSPPDSPPELIRPDDLHKAPHLPEKINNYEQTQRSPAKFKTSAPMYRKFSQITDEKDIISKSTPNLSEQRAFRPQVYIPKQPNDSPLRAHSTTKINQSNSFKISDQLKPGKPTLTHTPSFGSQSSQHSRTIYYAKVPAPTGRRSSTPDAHYSSRSSRKSDSDPASTIERSETKTVTKTRQKDQATTRPKDKSAKYIEVKPDIAKPGQGGVNIEVRDWGSRK